EREYIDECVRRQEQERRAEKDRQERELQMREQARRRLVKGVVVLAGLLVVMCVLGGVVYVEMRGAKQPSARLALDTGLSLAEQGDTARGMLWLAHSLQIAPDDAVFREDVREKLGACRAQLYALTAFQPPTRATNATVAAVSPDGRTFLTG